MTIRNTTETYGSLAAQIHELLAWTITGLLALHIAGALKHHIIQKDNVLRRMMPK